MAIRAVPDLPDVEAATREAWGYVADGYERALAVRGLDTFEVDALRKSLVAVNQIIGRPAARLTDEDS